MASEEQLFNEFPPVTADQWIQQAIKDLKGESFGDKLTYQSPEGITVKPFYTQEDLARYSHLKPLFSHTDWDICTEIDGTREAEGNKQALHALNNGATALLLYVNSDVNLQALLNGIQVQYIGVQFVVEGNADVFSRTLSEYLNSTGTDINTLNLSVNIDPVENLLRTGDWRNTVEQDRAEFINLIRDGKKALCINAAIYHNAGAPAAYEIGCTLAHAHTYLSWCSDQGIDLSSLAGKIQVNIAVGPDYFFGIAKLRALRKTFALLLETYGIRSDISIHAETAFRNMTVFDTHNNLLRTTTEAMAATIGGCNSLTVKPFDSTMGPGNEFSERMARNIQLILKAESYFDKIADASAGSYFIEELTEQISAKGWAYFSDIEKQGGLIEALTQGTVQETIRTFSDAQQERFNNGQDVLVGTNKFPNKDEQKDSQAASVIWGNTNATAKTIAPLTYTRLAAENEKQRLATGQ
jgi:methylmalonyl-CoA mutase